MDIKYNMIRLKYGNVRIGLVKDMIAMLDDEIEYYVSQAKNCKDSEQLIYWIARAYDDREQLKTRFKPNQIILFEINDKLETNFKIVGQINKEYL